MVGQQYAQSVNANYTSGDLGETILAAVRAAGKDPNALRPEDLAPVDQFHIGGKQTTRELIERAGLHAGMHILDVGGGLGGPARSLATDVGCTVTVLDLAEEYCKVGEMLTTRMGLSDRVTFQHGDALTMPFADSSFDAVWTQHSTMNIENKERLYAEIYRVLHPGGRLALHEVMAGPVQPIHFPVPWAYDATISFLRPPDVVRLLLKETRFTEIAWVDVTAPALAWFQAGAARQVNASSPPPLGLHLLLSDFATRGRNQIRNLAEGRTTVIQGVFARP